MPASSTALDSGTRNVIFTLFHPFATRVSVAGSFNGWQPDSTPMERDADGTWTVHVQLKPGTYEYRFLADGVWMDDPLAARYVANPFGETNSVRDIPPLAALGFNADPVNWP